MVSLSLYPLCKWHWHTREGKGGEGKGREEKEGEGRGEFSWPENISSKGSTGKSLQNLLSQRNLRIPSQVIGLEILKPRKERKQPRQQTC